MFKSGVIICVKPKWYQFLQDDTGKFSSMRLGFLITIIPVMFLWTYFSCKSHELIEIPKGVYSLVGVLATGKVSQLWVRNHYGSKTHKKCKQPDSIWSTIWKKVKKIYSSIRSRK